MKPEEQLFKRLGKNAQRRTIPWELDYDQWVQLANLNCEYCGAEPSNIFKYGKQEFAYSGIDRIDSGLGYEIGNVVPCCRYCNVLKSSQRPETWFDFLKSVIETHNGEIPESWIGPRDPERPKKAPNFWSRPKKR